jgi:hypothetical protein
VAGEVIGAQSLALLALATALAAASRFASPVRRGTAAGVILAATFVITLALPFPSSYERVMGDFGTYVASHDAFAEYTWRGGVRLEAHLSHVTLSLIDRWLGGTEETPRRAFVLLSRLGALLLVAALACHVWRTRASEVSLRFSALTIAAPSTLLLFEFKELGHLSLPAAALAFPLLLAAIQAGDAVRVAVGSGIAGVGAALHGFGLLTLVGSATAITAVVRPWRRAVELGMVAFAFGTAWYLIWLFVDMTILGVGVRPGHATGITLRPLLDSVIVDRRMNDAILSARGIRDVLVSAWIVGVPVFALVAWLARRDPLARLALLVSVPSLVWLVLFWPIQGLNAELDLVFGAFPAVFALLWVCARDTRLSLAAAALLASGHIAFWWVLLDGAFLNRPIV